MRRLPRNFASTSLLVLSASAAACATDSVPPDIYALYPTSSQSKDGAVGASKSTSKLDAGSGTKRDPGSATSDDTAGDTAGDTADDTAGSGTDDSTDTATDKSTGDTKPGAGALDGGVKQPGAEAGAASNGPCDLTGHWLISQHTVEQGLGVKQGGVWWFYYQLEQSGSDVTVKKGLVCAGRVFPIDLVAANVDWEKAWPAIVEKNTQHTGRLAKVTTSGTNCSVAFDPIYSVLGATSPYYADDSIALPLVAEKAAGDTPGWEDWDGDGKPGVSLIVTGIANGQRYTALRNLQDWGGKFTAGAATFKLPAVAKQDQSVLGVTNDLLKTSSVTDADPAVHFAQFAKLKPEQVKGDDQELCATIRELAPKLTPEANK
jgi:hypothetical protein